jgi:chaperonin GroES
LSASKPAPPAGSADRIRDRAATGPHMPGGPAVDTVGTVGTSKAADRGSTVARTRSRRRDRALVTSSKLRPLGDRCVVKPLPREEMTKSGIVLPDTVKEKPQEGEILAAGPGKMLDDGTREAMDVKVGDKVLYAKYAGTEFKVEGDDLLIVSQKDILAIVEA